MKDKPLVERSVPLLDAPVKINFRASRPFLQVTPPCGVGSTLNIQPVQGKGWDLKEATHSSLRLEVR